MDIDNLINGYKQIRRNFQRDFNSVVRMFEDDIIALNQERLSTGVDSDGRDLKSGKQYAESTIEIKKSEGKSTYPYNYHHTGNFYNKMKVIKKGKGYGIKSNVPYESEILEKNPEVYGLHKKQMPQISEAIFKSMVAKWKLYFR